MSNQHQSEKGRPFHLLVVEDNPEVRECYIEILSRSDYRVDIAEDGAAGLHSLERRKYDLVLTDHDMPNMNGTDLIQQLRQEGHKMPVIMVSGTISPQNASFQDLDLFALVEKPFCAASLLAKIDEALHLVPEPLDLQEA